MLLLIRLQTVHNLTQTRVSIIKVGPGEQHRSSTLTCAHIEHSLRSAASVARGAEAGTVLGSEGSLVRNKSECVHAKMFDSLLVRNGEGSAHVLVKNVEHLALFHMRRKDAPVSSMNPVTRPVFSLPIIVPSGQLSFIVIIDNRSKLKNIILSCVDFNFFLFSIILS